jgi:lysozyme family protein
MKSVDEIIEDIIKVEGGYVNHVNDLGGATMYGITEKVARVNGYTGRMQDLPKDLAKAIYLKQYFIGPKISLVFEVSEDVAAKMVDQACNLGPKWPAMWLQIALNMLNRNAKDYPMIVEDGAIGKGTVAALKALLAKRGKVGEEIVLKLLNVQQGARYMEICKARPANRDFMPGWIANRIGF